MRILSKLENYRLYCVHESLRYRCHYCGLDAPHFDKFPDGQKSAELTELKIKHKLLKTPVCKECLFFSKTCKNWEIKDRAMEIKHKIYKKYKHHLKAVKWEKSEIEELDYSLADLIQSHSNYKALIEKRLSWGLPGGPKK